MTYRLMKPEGTCTFCKIMHGRRWVGRVTQHEDGTWLAVIGDLMVRGKETRESAFDDVVAKYLGYPSADALRLHNAKVRAQRRRLQGVEDVLADDIMRGYYDRVDKLGAAGLLMALRGATRNLRKRR